MGFSSINLESVWSILPEAYCVNLPCELKITRAISQSHRMLSHTNVNQTARTRERGGVKEQKERGSMAGAGGEGQRRTGELYKIAWATPMKHFEALLEKQSR